ncbi:hypothetical protein H4582DRAFT_2060443 [Lactarius indigo]|nr:hypothetical protein H4582DRAFT_2060443 [Lactarius indigo]
MIRAALEQRIKRNKRVFSLLRFDRAAPRSLNANPSEQRAPNGAPWGNACAGQALILTSDELGVPRSVLRDYAARGNNLSLSVLIHIMRRQFDHFGKSSWPWIKFSLILEMASKFDAQDTSPELQHEFCALWSQIVLKAQNDNSQAIAVYLLRPIRKIYIALHRDTNSAPKRFSASTGNLDDILFWQSSYPVCNVAGHIHEGSASTAYVRDVSNDNVALAPASSAGPGPFSLSAPAPLRVIESLTDVPPLGTFHPAHRATIESHHIPATSPDPVITHVIQDNTDTSTRTISTSTPDTLASTLPISKASSHSTGTAHAHHAGTRSASSGHLDDPSSPSPNPVLDNMLPTEYHLSVLAPASASLSRPRLPSVPNLSPVTEGEGSVKADFRKEKDTFYPSPGFEDAMSTPDLPPVTVPKFMIDVTIVGHSQRSLDAKYTGGHPPNLPHDQYDIV